MTILRTRGWLLSVALLACACTSESDVGDARQTYVGTVETSDAWVAVVVDGDAVTGYVCGGPATVATHTTWFEGQLTADGAFELDANGFVLRGTYDGQRYAGTLVDPTNTELSWTSTQAEGDPGLYRLADDAGITGVIVRDDGTLVGQGASCPKNLGCAQVIILAPITTEDGAIVVEFDAVSVKIPRF